MSDVPKWVAPEGELQDFGLGDPVWVRAKLTQDFDPDFGGWRRDELYQEVQGVIVGRRFPYSGEVVPSHSTPGSFMGPPEYTGGYRKRQVTHRCYLVAYDMGKKPVYVLGDDVREVQDED